LDGTTDASAEQFPTLLLTQHAPEQAQQHDHGLGCTWRASDSFHAFQNTSDKTTKAKRTDSEKHSNATAS